MAKEVVLDVLHTEPFKHLCTDRNDWCPVGPGHTPPSSHGLYTATRVLTEPTGAQRGLNRLFGRPARLKGSKYEVTETLFCTVLSFSKSFGIFLFTGRVGG
jgi:hypothetical protein